MYLVGHCGRHDRTASGNCVDRPTGPHHRQCRGASVSAGRRRVVHFSFGIADQPRDRPGAIPSSIAILQGSTSRLTYLASSIGPRSEPIAGLFNSLGDTQGAHHHRRLHERGLPRCRPIRLALMFMVALVTFCISLIDWQARHELPVTTNDLRLRRKTRSTTETRNSRSDNWISRFRSDPDRIGMPEGGPWGYGARAGHHQRH